MSIRTNVCDLPKAGDLLQINSRTLYSRRKHSSILSAYVDGDFCSEAHENDEPFGSATKITREPSVTWFCNDKLVKLSNSVQRPL